MDRPTVKRPAELILSDPLSEVTRKERKSLLIASAVGIAIAKTGLVPSKISALGIEFTQADKTALLRVLVAVVAYFIVAFVVYAASDFIWWRVAIHTSTKEWSSWSEHHLDEDARSDPPITYRLLTRLLGMPTSVLRAVFDFCVPLAIAGYAIHALLNVK